LIYKEVGFYKLSDAVKSVMLNLV